jgi:glutathione S-transferase
VSDEIVFFHNPNTRARIVHWMLEECGAPYRVELLDFAKKQHKTPEYLALNPLGKVPTIVHRGTVVTEAAAICAYLADAFPEHRLAPSPTDPARGTYFRWLFFASGCLEPALVDHQYQRPELARAGVVGYGSYDEAIDAIERAITPGPWILGEQFTAADVFVGTHLGWGLRFGTIAERPAFARYVERRAQRPAFMRTEAQNLELRTRMQG